MFHRIISLPHLQTYTTRQLLPLSVLNKPSDAVLLFLFLCLLIFMKEPNESPARLFISSFVCTCFLDHFPLIH
jgi:hypothetical protein